MRGHPRLLLLSVLTLASGCAAARVARENESARLAADAKTAEGCYDCLLEAREIYARQSDPRDSSLVTAKLFEIDVLIYLRERELALDWTASFARAVSAARKLPADIDGPRLLRLAAATRPDEFGLTAPMRDTARRAAAEFNARREPEVIWLEQNRWAPLLRDYLLAALDCSRYGATSVLPTQRVEDQVAPITPIIRYRRASCGAFDSVALNQVRTVVPRFVETSYFLAQLHLAEAEKTGGAAVNGFLVDAYSRFRNSSGVTYLRGQLARMTGECETGLGFFDETLALRPTHDQALLGRTVCLTDLKRHAPATTVATQMIELGVPMLHEGYYWRAVNKRALGDLPAARADIDVARSIAGTGEILTMAGIIAFEQDDFAPAERDLKAARQLLQGEQNCAAVWYLGRVYAGMERWPDAASHFELSMTCCDGSVLRRMRSMAALTAAADIDPAYRTRRLRQIEERIKEDRTLQYASAFNAANYHARAGNRARARELVDIAAVDPALADAVARLRAALRGGT